MRAVSAEGLLKLNVGFWDFECLYRKFNRLPDWFLNFECRLLNFQLERERS